VRAGERADGRLSILAAIPLAGGITLRVAGFALLDRPTLIVFLRVSPCQ